MRKSVPILGVVLLGLLVTSCDETLDSKSQGPQFIVRMLPGGDRCAVLQRELDCRSIPAALRDELKVSLDTYISVEFDPAVVTEHQASTLLDSLDAAGFHSTIGTIWVGRPPDKR